MGQKVHPYGFRLGVNKPWRSRWFSERDYDKLLVEDVKLRAELKEKLGRDRAAGQQAALSYSHCTARYRNRPQGRGD
jgi:hypothetical protein